MESMTKVTRLEDHFRGEWRCVRPPFRGVARGGSRWFLALKFWINHLFDSADFASSLSIMLSIFCLSVPLGACLR